MSEQESQATVYGTTWCPDCKRVKQFLAGLRIPFKSVNIEENSVAMNLVESINNGKKLVPTIVFPDGKPLINPDNAALAKRLGFMTEAAKRVYDVIIVGGGPTGLTAGIYTAREGLDTLLIENSGLGGQIGITEQLENFPGFHKGISGAEFANNLGVQAERFGVEILQAQRVEEIADWDTCWTVTTASGQDYCAKAILIATGAKYRRLNIPGEDELIGVNVHFCATCDGAFYKGKEVLVIGGGNSGFEEGLFLTKFAKKVTIVEFSPQVQASQILQDKVAARADMEAITNHAVKEFLVDNGKLAGVKVEDRASSESKEWHPDGVFVFVGMSPNSKWLPLRIKRDRWGFVITDKTLMTKLEGIFAAGDVRQGSTKQAVSAAGEGAAVALMMRQYLES